MRWDEFDETTVDDEVTELTEFAIRFAKRSAGMAVAAGDIAEFECREAGAAVRFYVPARPGGIGNYVTEVRGQASATAHGMQGSNPGRIARLRALAEEAGVPVRMVFVDQRNAVQQEQHWQEVWLDRIEPEVHWISKAPTQKRQGWKVREMRQGTGLIEFPEAAPEPIALAQEALL